MMINKNSNLVILLGILAVGFLLAAGITNAQATKSPSRPRQYGAAPQKKAVRTLLEIIEDHLAGKNPQDEKVIIPAKGGGLVANNIFKAAKFSHDERYLGYKILDGVEYSAGGGWEGFVMIAHGDNNALLMLEERFIKLLGVTKADACRLELLEYLAPPGSESRYVRKSFSFCAGTTVAQISRPQRTSTTSKITIGYISPAGGCGCYFGLKRTSDFDESVFSNDCEGVRAWMNIDAQEVELRRVGASRKYGDLYRVGDISVRIRTWMTKGPENEESEVAERAGTITITKGTRRKTVRVVGECAGG
jgi:hypothetical protein